MTIQRQRPAAMILLAMTLCFLSGCARQSPNVSLTQRLKNADPATQQAYQSKRGD